jgi:hypothetical protein
MKITTNNVPRDIIEAYELTENEQAEFDYLDWKKIRAGDDSASFFRYKGNLYDLGEFERADIEGWDGIQHDTYFSGIIVRYCNEFEQVVVGRYFT